MFTATTIAGSGRIQATKTPVPSAGSSVASTGRRSSFTTA